MHCQFKTGWRQRNEDLGIGSFTGRQLIISSWLIENIRVSSVTKHLRHYLNETVIKKQTARQSVKSPILDCQSKQSGACMKRGGPENALLAPLEINCAHSNHLSRLTLGAENKLPPLIKKKKRTDMERPTMFVLTRWSKKKLRNRLKNRQQKTKFGAQEGKHGQYVWEGPRSNSDNAALNGKAVSRASQRRSSDDIDYKSIKQLTKRIYGHEMPKAMKASYAKNIAYMRVSTPVTMNTRPANVRNIRAKRQRSQSVHVGERTPPLYTLRGGERHSSPRVAPTLSAAPLHEMSTEEWCPTAKTVDKAPLGGNPYRCVGAIRPRPRESKGIAPRSDSEKDLFAFAQDEELVGWWRSYRRSMFLVPQAHRQYLHVVSCCFYFILLKI